MLFIIAVSSILAYEILIDLLLLAITLRNISLNCCSGRLWKETNKVEAIIIHLELRTYKATKFYINTSGSEVNSIRSNTTTVSARDNATGIVITRRVWIK